MIRAKWASLTFAGCFLFTNSGCFSSGSGCLPTGGSNACGGFFSRCFGGSSGTTAAAPYACCPTTPGVGIASAAPVYPGVMAAPSYSGSLPGGMVPGAVVPGGANCNCQNGTGSPTFYPTGLSSEAGMLPPGAMLSQGGPMSMGPISQGPLMQGPIGQGSISQGPISQGPITSGPVMTAPPITTQPPSQNPQSVPNIFTIPKTGTPSNYAIPEAYKPAAPQTPFFQPGSGF